jgi:RNA polymerase sigma-70 factor (ECF subfamily)
VADTRNDNLDEIIQGCLKKKLKSQEMLYKRFFGYALSVAMIHNKNRDNALEIVNDSFVKVFNQIGRFDNTLSFKSWLNKIVINTSIDKFRKNNKNILYDDKETFLVPDESPNILTELTAQDILRLLNLLPEIHRLVFSLYEIEGYSHDEISEMLKIPENTSRVYLSRAKKRLRELFQMYFNTNYEKIGNR